jgi:hypothetical protein
MAWPKGKVPGPMAGKHHTKETRLKISLAHKGKKRTAEHRQHIIDACKDNPKCRGYHFSEEAKKKLSIRLRRYWKQRKQLQQQELQ